MQEFKHIRIAEMTPDQAVEGFYLLKTVSLKSSGSGKAFLTGKLQDITGETDFVVWDCMDNTCFFPFGSVIKIRGTVTTYNGNPQISISRIRLATENDSVDLSQIVPSAPINVEETIEELKKTIAEIKDHDYRKICETMFRKHLMNFLTLPAAKTVHHAFLHGLLMHTCNMMRTAVRLAPLYEDVPINPSLLVAGVFCHDLNKDREMTTSSIGLVTEYSVEGSLLGHTYLGAREIHDVCIDLKIPEEKTLLLEHLLLSHHGEPEMGAAVRPVCAEAALLNLIDLIDSRMEIYRETNLKTDPGSMSEKVWALNHGVYHHY